MTDSFALRLDDRATAISLCALFAFVAMAIVFGHRGVAPAIMLMGLVTAARPKVWVDGWRTFGWPLRPDRPSAVASAATFAFVLWIAATDIWSPTLGGWRLALNVLVPILCAGALCWLAGELTLSWRRRVAAGFAAMTAFAGALLLIEGLGSGSLRAVVPPTDESPGRIRDMIALGRGMTALAPMVPPAAIIVWVLTGSRLAGFALAAGVFAGSLTLPIAANVLALIVGAAAFVAGLLLGRRTPVALTLAVLASIAAALTLAPSIPPLPTGSILANVTPLSWSQRTIIWRETARRAEECQPYGCGAEFARAIHAEGVMTAAPGSSVPLSVMPTHPHNVPLEIWLELGAVGIALLLCMLIAAGWAWSQIITPSLIQASVAAVTMIGVTSFLVEASVWQVWRLSALGLGGFGCTLAAALLADARPPRQSREH